MIRMGAHEKLCREGFVVVIASSREPSQAYLYLTSERLVICAKRSFAAIFGPLAAFFHKPIVMKTELFLQDLVALTKDEARSGVRYVLHGRQGPMVTLQFVSEAEPWVKSVIQARLRRDASVRVRKEGARLEFYSYPTCDNG